jgi:hypothetical protein
MNRTMAPRPNIAVLLALCLGVGLSACADREEVRARQMAQDATANAEDDQACRQKGEPGTEFYDHCRKELAAARAQRNAIDWQKSRDFDRVLGAGTSGPSETY